MRDLLYKNEGFIFSYRVGGILIHDQKVLLQHYKGDYTVIGGHVNGMETHEQALKREFMEELGAKIEVDELVAIGENFFKWEDTPWHQICIYYNVHLCQEDSIFMDGVYHGQDEWEDGVFDLDYCWIPLKDVEKLHMVPKELSAYILGIADDIHYVSNEMEGVEYE